MPELLLEIGTDEMPYRMVSAIAEDLSLRARVALAENTQAEGGIRVLHTPRRVALIASDLSENGLTPERLGNLISQSLASGMIGSASDSSAYMSIAHLVLLYDDQVVPVRVKGVNAGNVTRGHWRTTGGEEIRLSSQVDYESALAELGVVVDQERRVEMVREAIASVAREVGASIEADETQIERIANEVEYPQPVNCQVNIPPDLPAPFVEAALLAEGFVPLATGEDRSIRFVGFADGVVDQELVRAGYERVSQSALRRSLHLFQRDRRTPLADHVRSLRGISDKSGLGSLWEKTERLRTLAGGIAQVIGASLEAVDRATFLSQADRATWIVREFPSLHGVAGATFARLDGEEEVVSRALEEGAFSSSRGIEVASEGLALAIAERYDDLCLSLLAGGDERAAEVVAAADDLIGLMIAGKVDLDLVSLLDTLHDQYRLLTPAITADDLKDAQFTALEERVVYYLETSEQITGAIVPAVPRRARANPYRADSCARALQEASDSGVLSSLESSFDRLREHFQGASARSFDPTLFEDESERALWREYLKAEGKLEGLLAELDYEEAIDQLSSLAGPINRYFEDVDLSAGSMKLRNNRLGLVACVVDLYDRVGDFDAFLAANDPGSGEEKR